MYNLLRYSPARMQLFDPWGLDALVENFVGDNLAIDLYEQGDKLVVKAALPGLKQDEIELSEQNGILTILAQHESDEQREHNGWCVRQQRSGIWQRSLSLPAAVDANRARATLEQGVLTIVLPKHAPHQTLMHRIKVNLPKIKLPGLKKSKGKIKIFHN